MDGWMACFSTYSSVGQSVGLYVECCSSFSLYELCVSMEQFIPVGNSKERVPHIYISRSAGAGGGGRRRRRNRVRTIRRK